MKIRCVWEHNGDDTLLYADNFIGAFARGKSKEDALGKIKQEVVSYLNWCHMGIPDELTAEITQEKQSTLQVSDADSDVLFDEEKKPMTYAEYIELKTLVLKSAEDFHTLYHLVPEKDQSVLPERTTFYGKVPRTANEMYEHTKNVNSYYFGEIGVETDNDGSILECRKRGFEKLEQMDGYLNNTVFCGSYDEQWSLRKMLRRFLWHDRIHAKAMYKMAIKTFGEGSVWDVFHFTSLADGK